MAAIIGLLARNSKYLKQYNASPLLSGGSKSHPLTILGSTAYCFSTSSRDDKEQLFDKILIANRGEIACRVMQTCQRLGIGTVAVYSEADLNAKHVAMADEAVCIGPPPSNQSYLLMDNVVDACLQTGAQAVHPGYGFLSENYLFYDKLGDAGVTFIGPNKHALHAMGDKIESKRIALNAKVNCIPGYDGVVKDDEEAVKLAAEIGYPVMLKASAGGGGKGMRIAYNEQEVRAGFRLSSQEAAKSFNDDRLLIEKFVEDPRHIEVQIMADKHGNVVYLNERECSIQRRNQKVIEEAPSPFIDPETRKAMGAQAVMLAKEVGYNSAGTVEFLVDKHKNFYFLEMNTRLQVEHPITEQICGVDLVEHMIRSAYGQVLPMAQEDVQLNGWAVESRVYAEDPYKNFGLPSTGRLNRYVEPSNIPGVRCDSGIVEGTDISIYYDSMICKLVTYGPDRETTLNTMDKALDSYVIRGLSHNIPLLRDVMDNKRFRSGNITTKFLEEEYPEGFNGRQLTSPETDQLITAAAYTFLRRQQSTSKDIDLYVRVGKEGEFTSVKGRYAKGELKATLNDSTEVQLTSDSLTSSALLESTINGEDVIMQNISRKGQHYKIQHLGTVYDVELLTKLQLDLSKHMVEKPKPAPPPYLLTPMPGVVISIDCQVGDTVFEGQEVCVVEAMKLQNSLAIAKTGVVKSIKCAPGDSLQEGDVILELEE